MRAKATLETRPDKVIPTDGADLVARWNDELRALGYRDPAGPAVLEGDGQPVVGDAESEPMAAVAETQPGFLQFYRSYCGWTY